MVSWEKVNKTDGGHVCETAGKLPRQAFGVILSQGAIKISGCLNGAINTAVRLYSALFRRARCPTSGYFSGNVNETSVVGCALSRTTCENGMTSRSHRQTPPPHPLFIAGMLAIPLGTMWTPLLIVAAGCLGWWLLKIEKPRLLSRHKAEIKGEDVDLGTHRYPLTECSMTEPRFFPFQYGLPQVRQLVTLQHMDSGTVHQFWIITRPVGRTTLHPITND